VILTGVIPKSCFGWLIVVFHSKQHGQSADLIAQRQKTPDRRGQETSKNPPTAAKQKKCTCVQNHAGGCDSPTPSSPLATFRKSTMNISNTRSIHAC